MDLGILVNLSHNRKMDLENRYIRMDQYTKECGKTTNNMAGADMYRQIKIFLRVNLFVT